MEFGLVSFLVHEHGLLRSNPVLFGEIALI
jgi:hypothetical protein